MKKEWFFDNTGRCLDEELEEINVDNHQLNLEPMLPGEEVIGELNVSEKRLFMWVFLMGEKIRQVQPDNEDLMNSARVEQYISELELIKAKTDVCLSRIVVSLFKRFRRGSLAVKGNCKVVICKESLEEIEGQLEERKKSIALSMDFFRNAGNVQH